MFRFVDLTPAYWLDPADAPPLCGIIDTVTDKFLPDAMGCHVLGDLDEVREAGGERAVNLVPEGFFEGREVSEDLVTFSVPCADGKTCDLDAFLLPDGTIKIGGLLHEHGVVVSAASAVLFAEALLRMTRGGQVGGK